MVGLLGCCGVGLLVDAQRVGVFFVFCFLCLTYWFLFCRFVLPKHGVSEIGVMVMTKYFVTLEAWDGDSDYDVFDSLEDAATSFRHWRDSDEWLGVFADIRLVEYPVTDAEIARHEAETDEVWSLWDVFADVVTLDRWSAPKCQQEGFTCGSPALFQVRIETNVWGLCEECANAVVTEGRLDCEILDLEGAE